MSTEVTTTPKRAPAPAARSEQYERALQNTEQALAALDRPLLERGDFVEACRIAERRGPAEARALLPRLPSLQACEARQTDITAALAAPPNRKGYRAIIALMVDAFPSGRPPNLDVYASCILHDLCEMGFTPLEVVAACRAIRRDPKRVFLPSVGEVIGACEEARAQLRSKLQITERYAEVIRTVGALASQPDGED